LRLLILLEILKEYSVENGDTIFCLVKILIFFCKQSIIFLKIYDVSESKFERVFFELTKHIGLEHITILNGLVKYEGYGGFNILMIYINLSTHIISKNDSNIIKTGSNIISPTNK